MPGNFLDQVSRNPHGWGYGYVAPTASDVTYDEYGQPYDARGVKIPLGADPSLASSLLNIAESPARIAAGFAAALSPYGSDGWQIPPAISDPFSAYQRLAQNGRFQDGRPGIPNPDNLGNQNDSRAVLGAMVGGNASRGMAAGRALPSLEDAAYSGTASQLAGSNLPGVRDWAQAAYRTARHPLERAAIDDQATLDYWKEVAQLQQYIRDRGGHLGAADYVRSRLPDAPSAPNVFNDYGLEPMSAYERAALDQALKRRMGAQQDGLGALKQYRRGGSVPSR